MQIHTSRLLGPAPVLEFTMTLMDDLRIDWQFQNFSGRHWTPPEIRLLLIRLAQTLPDTITAPPQGGPLAESEGRADRRPLGMPTSVSLADPRLEGVSI